jgi:uncharacterized membrane protein YdjX (TVP38/TMEM64 family)
VRRALPLLAVGAALAPLAAPPVRAALGEVGRLLLDGDLAALRAWLLGFGPWAPLVSLALLQVQAVLAPLPSLPLMVANGYLFGPLWGGLLSWAGILLSAFLCFGLARRLGRPLVERCAGRAPLARADAVLERHGPVAVLLARLVPLTAFDLVSYAAGLTSMRVGPFLVATGLGMAPAVFLAAAAGHLAGRAPGALGGGLVALAVVGAGLAVLAARRRPRVPAPIRPPAA